MMEQCKGFSRKGSKEQGIKGVRDKGQNGGTAEGQKGRRELLDNE
jgi:hypothetical protein